MRSPVGKRKPYGALSGLLLGVLALLAGCNAPATGEPAAVEAKTAKKAKLGPADSWDASFMGKAKVGYSHNVRQRLTEDGRDLWHTRSETRLKLSRLGQTIELNLDITSVDDQDGNLVRFDSRVNLGPVPTVARGRVAGEKLDLEITTAGKTTKQSIPLPAGTGGFFAIEQSLERSPMQPGEVRRFKSILPIFNQVAEVTLTAADYEMTRLLDGKEHKLLKIASSTALPGQAPLPGVIWTDEEGQSLKGREEAMDQWSYRTTQKIALQEGEEASPDLIGLSIVKLDPGSRNPHDAREVRYRITLKDADPLSVFPSSASQTVKRIGPHEAEITVRAIRPGDGHTPPTATKPTDGDLKPNNMIQSDDETVIAMAKEGAATEKDPWAKAVALERYVRGAMKLADFSQTLASAAEVAKSRRGDCTEHAVLLAALARAQGIPSRVAVGLVYAAPLGGFGFHMWTEVLINGEWIPLDGTLGRGGIGGGHLKLADTNFASGSTDSFLPVYQVIGRLKIEMADKAK